MSDSRPEWKHSITEVDARWFLAGMIVKITHHREMTGEDTSRDWVELHTEDRGKKSVASSWLNTNGYFEFKPNWRELVTPTYRGEQLRKDFDAIEAWEKKNQRDRSEYERLRKKFEGGE